MLTAWKCDDGDDELFCGTVDRRKAFRLSGPLSEILTIANLQHAASGFEPAQNLSSGFVVYLNIFLEVFVNHQSQKSRKFCIDIKYEQIIQYN